MNKEKNRQGNLNKIHSWMMNDQDYPQHFCSAGYAFLRKYDSEKLYTTKAIIKHFKIKNIVWCDDEKNINRKI